MWIELEEEIFHDIESIDNPYDKRVLALNSLFDSMWKCQHIVYASYSSLEKMLRHPMISATNQKFISWIMQKYVYVYECSEIVACKVFVTSEDIKLSKDENGFRVSLSSFINVRETKLLTENESDALFFQRIFAYISQIKELASTFDIKFENDAFHGGNAPSKIQQAADEGRMMICITDSDRDYVGGRRGSTWEGANKKVNKLKRNHIIHLYELGVREKENLLAPEMYLLFEENGLLSVVNREFMDSNTLLYFDIKEGVAYKRIIQPDERWNSHYGKLVERCRAYEICNEEACSEKDVYIKGIGGSICDTVSSVLLAKDKQEETNNMRKASLSKEKQLLITQEREKLLAEIPECIMQEWIRIYNLLFTWGCRLSKKALPIYE